MLIFDYLNVAPGLNKYSETETFLSEYIRHKIKKTEING